MGLNPVCDLNYYRYLAFWLNIGNARFSLLELKIIVISDCFYALVEEFIQILISLPSYHYFPYI